MHDVPVKLAMELGVGPGLAWVLATAVALHKHNRQHRYHYEQPEQRPAVPNYKVQKVGGQEYHRGKGHRQIPDSLHLLVTPRGRAPGDARLLPDHGHGLGVVRASWLS